MINHSDLRVGLEPLGNEGANMETTDQPKVVLRLINENGIHPSEEEARGIASKLDTPSDPRLSFGEPFYSERDLAWYVDIKGFDRVADD